MNPQSGNYSGNHGHHDPGRYSGFLHVLIYSAKNRIFSGRQNDPWMNWALKNGRIGIFVYFTNFIILIQSKLMNLFRKKTLSSLLAQAADSEKSLKRTLGAWNLIALGIGAIIGAGLFVRTAAAAGEHAGSAVTISFLVASIGCAFAGLCYADFASMIPIAGSAYTYAYATMGELVAWIIGWD